MKESRMMGNDEMMKCSKSEFRMRIINIILVSLIFIDIIFQNTELLMIEIPVLILSLWYNKILHDNLFGMMWAHLQRKSI